MDEQEKNNLKTRNNRKQIQHQPDLKGASDRAAESPGWLA